MRQIRLNLLICVSAALALAPLSTDAAPRNSAFDPNSENGLLVIVSNEIGAPSRGAYIYLLRAIDHDSQTFKGNHRTVVVATNGSNTLNGRDEGAPFFFVSMRGLPRHHAREIPPGDYALIGAESLSGGEVLATSTFTSTTPLVQTLRCFSEGAPTFSVRAGEIAIVKTDGINISDAEILAIFATVRAPYANLRGTARVVDVSRRITFSASEADARNACLNATHFEEIEAD